MSEAKASAAASYAPTNEGLRTATAHARLENMINACLDKLVTLQQIKHELTKNPRAAELVDILQRLT